ncbi:HNH endonuclease [Herpetosiphon llansteffanensis]|uniref:HNH endonuclease n=1 Tax=Herpetosiphon llansteffanensis TaxID=2094568 RepID=UPI000D7C02F0|nr:HNH endonuclease [Herpetosiphon llansteffanensis]
MHARDFVQPGKRLLALFTNGHLLTFNNDGTGSSGNWIMDDHRINTIDQVLIYLRDDSNINKLYTATYKYAEKVEDGRYCVYFEHYHYIKEIEQNWVQFTGAQQVVRYFE